MRAGPRGGFAILAIAPAALGAPALAGAAPAPEGLHVSSFAAPAALEIGDRAAISGRVSPPAAVPVAVERLEGGAWRTLVTLTSGADGRFAARLPLARTSNMRVSVQRADGTTSSSRRRSIALRRRVALSVSAGQLENISGRPFVAIGSVALATPGERVALEGSVNGRPFRTIARLAVRSGRVRARFTPPGGGSWRFRIAVDPTPGRDVGGAATTPAMRVYGSNPHGAPTSAAHYLVQQISDFHLYYYQRGKLRRVFPVVFGKASTPTPVGRFSVYSKTNGPSSAFGPRVLWYHRGYGIHGTNQEYLLAEVTRYFSHGCTRNYNANILWLWDRVPVGAPVVNIP
jgi:lipoprotein-anchoring transpeptidase ErfK/SrfK